MLPDLLKAFDYYNNEFTIIPYFIICFNAPPSSISFETRCEDSKEIMESVIAALDFKKFNLQEIFKYWSTEDEKDSDSSQDFPTEYLLKSDNRNLIIHIKIKYRNLNVTIFYDITIPDLEKEAISIFQTLRQKFGTKKSPTFQVLTYRSNNFDTEDIQNEFPQVNIGELYNDDFEEINAIIEKSLEQDKSGLILLHGVPGTGKTSYIKSLISKFQDDNFIFIQNEFVQDLLKPDFISFLLRNRNSILVIEDAEKVITTRENVSENSVVSTILQLTDGLFSDYLNIKIICTFNTNIDKVDKALLRKGRLIANYEFKPLSAEKTNKLLEGLGHDLNETDLTLADIFNFKEKSFVTSDNKKKIGFNK